MKKGEIEINLRNVDGEDIGERIITDGIIHRLYSRYGRRNPMVISTGTLKAILQQHTDGLTLADIAVALSI